MVVAVQQADSSISPSGGAVLNFTAAQANSLLLVWSWNYGLSGSLTAPSGFTLLRSDAATSNTQYRLFVWYKIAAGGETSVTVPANSGGFVAGAFMELIGADTTTPFSDNQVDTTAQSGGSVGATAPSATVPANGLLVCIFGESLNTTTTPPSGMTEQGDAHIGNGSTIFLSLETATQTGVSGASGTRQHTVDAGSGSSRFAVAQSLAINPAPSVYARTTGGGLSLVTGDSSTLEGGTVGAWTGASVGYTTATVSNSVAQASKGTHSLGIAFPAASANLSGALINVTGMTPGQRHVMFVDVYANPGTGPLNISEAYGVFGVQSVPGYPTTTSTTGQWERLAIAFTPDVATRTFVLRSTAATGGSEFAYLDEFYVYEGDGAGRQTDTLLAELGLATSTTDSTVLTDAVSDVEGYALSPTDLRGLTDTITDVEAFALVQTDSTVLTDAPSSLTGYVRTLPTDVSGLVDTTADAESYTVAPDDTLGRIDTNARVAAFALLPTDPAGLADAMTDVEAFGLAQTDSTVLTDSASGLTGYVRVLPDEVGLTDGNLLTGNQSSLEASTLGWVAASNTTISRSTAQAFTGTASLALVATGTADISANAWDGVVKVLIAPNTTYTASLVTRAATVARANQVVINWYTSAGAFISQIAGDAAMNTTAGWTAKAVTADSPSNAAFAIVSFYVGGGGLITAGETHYVDAVALIRGTTEAGLVSDFVRTLSDDTRGVVDTATSAEAFARTHDDPLGKADAATSLRGVLGHLPPDAILLEIGATGPVSYIQEDPASTDGQPLTGTGALDLRVSFGSPGGTLMLGASVQKFRVLAKI